MKKEYDFSKGKRGAVVPLPPGKLRITIRLDKDILEWFKATVDAAGGGNYQTMMNDALREFMTSKRQPLEHSLRRVVREELAAYRTKRRKPR
jgi:uncharacterized protein (DUF4415 family)